jgi:hemoglobin
MKRDIETNDDLYLIMKTFYDYLLSDDDMRPIFVDVAKIDLEPHLQDLVLFWENMLFRPNGYRKPVMHLHIDIHKKYPFKEIHFEKWLNYLTKSVNDNFEGNKANELLQRANHIALVMKHKTQQYGE